MAISSIEASSRHQERIVGKNGFGDLDKFLKNALEEVKQDAISDVAADEIKRLTAEEPPAPGHEWYLVAVDNPTSNEPKLRFATRPVAS